MACSNQGLKDIFVLPYTTTPFDSTELAALVASGYLILTRPQADINVLDIVLIIGDASAILLLPFSDPVTWDAGEIAAIKAEGYLIVIKPDAPSNVLTPELIIGVV